MIRLSADDRRALAQGRYHRPDPRIQRTTELLWLKGHGRPHHRSAASEDVPRRSVRRSPDQSLEDGLQGLRRGPWPHPESASAEHETSLEESFRGHPPRSAKQARAVIEQRTGLRRGRTQVRHLLKERPGPRGRKAGAIAVPPEETIQGHAREQATFVREEPEPRLKRARRGRRQVSFGDGAHLVFAPSLGFLRRATRRFVRAASGRARYNVPGAPDAVTHRLIGVTSHEDINAESVRAPWPAVAAAAVGLPIRSVLDDARDRRCAVGQARAWSLGIERLYLPGYSPKRNLIERLWRSVREESPESTSYEDLAQFTTATDRPLDGLPTVPEGEMEALLTHKVQMFGDVTLVAA